MERDIRQLNGPAIHARIEREHREQLSDLGLEAWEINFLLYITASETLMQDLKNDLDATLDPCNTAGRVITVFGGTLYAAIRLMLLSLAFCALRYVPEGVYTTSWTRVLPNVS